MTLIIFSFIQEKIHPVFNPLSANVEFIVCSALIGKIIKNSLNVFELGGNLLQNGTLHFAFKLNQSLEIVLQSNLHRQKTDVLRAWHLKG